MGERIKKLKKIRIHREGTNEFVATDSTMLAHKAIEILPDNHVNWLAE